MRISYSSICGTQNKAIHSFTGKSSGLNQREPLPCSPHRLFASPLLDMTDINHVIVSCFTYIMKNCAHFAVPEDYSCCREGKSK